MYRVVLILACLMSVVMAADSPEVGVREPAVAGQFYPADSAELSAMVKTQLNGAVDEAKIDGQILAIFVPHAGLVYSGPTAAFAFKLLQNSSFKNIVLCGPTHHYGFRGISVYGPSMTWKTPLGTIACNDAICNAILKNDKAAAIIPQAHTEEHCLEVELPFLQTVLPNFQIVPVIMGNQDGPTIDGLAKALEAVPTDNTTLMVASSDWQHYRPAAQGYPMDSLGMDCFVHLDPDRLEKYFASGQVEMCGGGPAAAVLKAAIAKGGNRVKILRYSDSGDITGDKNSVVGYVAAVVYKAPGGAAKDSTLPSESSVRPIPPSGDEYQLSTDERKKLLEIARKSIQGYLTTQSVPDFEVPAKLKEPGAAFVTLTKQGDLRGCIGYTVAVQPLYQTVAQCAISAAISDPRFEPVKSDELAGLDIEISVLTPLVKVTSLDQIQVGRDGLMITMGNNHGLLLPQVATEYHWNRTQFLQQTCYKAGLPTDAYLRPEALIQKFQALVFGEKDVAGK